MPTSLLGIDLQKWEETLCTEKQSKMTSTLFVFVLKDSFFVENFQTSYRIKFVRRTNLGKSALLSYSETNSTVE